MLSNSSRCAVAAVPPLISFTCTMSSRLSRRGSSPGRWTPPIAARNASLPMRPMPLMPTLMASPSHRCPLAVAQPVEALLERDAVERGVRQVDEDLQTPADHAIELVDHDGALDQRSLELGRIGQRPGGGDRLAADIDRKS